MLQHVYSFLLSPFFVANGFILIVKQPQLFISQDSFAAPRLAVLRNVFQKASGVQAAAAAGGDELQLLLDFPHVDDVTLILRGSTRAHTFMQLEELCTCYPVTVCSQF